MKLLDITGQKFGRLTAVKRCENDNGGFVTWICKCDCGNIIKARTGNLRSGNTTSCGCYKKELICRRETNEYKMQGDICLVYTKKGIPVIIDKEDYEKIKGYLWYTSKGYALTHFKGTTLKIHRIILNIGEGMVVDHINGNPLDNRKANLRICTQHQNAMNVKKPKNNKSGIKGVRWVENRHKWEAFIGYNRKQIHLGQFDSVDEAVNARKNAEAKYYGEYANDR